MRIKTALISGITAIVVLIVIGGLLGFIPDAQTLKGILLAAIALFAAVTIVIKLVIK